MTLPPRFHAAVFDMDGTLVDNMSFHARAWVEVTRRLGLEVPAERFERDFAGFKNEEIFPLLLERPVSAEEVQRWAAEKEELYRALYRPHLALVAGAAELLARLAAAGVQVALATAAPVENRSFVLDGLGIRSAFVRIVGQEDAARGKPAPDIFLATAAALGVEPSACVAFEDALNGVRAARAAGMPTVGVTTTLDDAALAEVGAAWTIQDFTRLPDEVERRLTH
jgi:beta-phosphoglucomutase family hydrolase